MTSGTRVRLARWIFETFAAKSITLAICGSVVGLFGLVVGEPFLVDVGMASGAVALAPVVVCLALLGWQS